MFLSQISSRKGLLPIPKLYHRIYKSTVLPIMEAHPRKLFNEQLLYANLETLDC